MEQCLLAPDEKIISNLKFYIQLLPLPNPASFPSAGEIRMESEAWETVL